MQVNNYWQSENKNWTFVQGYTLLPECYYVFTTVCCASILMHSCTNSHKSWLCLFTIRKEDGCFLLIKLVLDAATYRKSKITFAWVTSFRQTEFMVSKHLIKSLCERTLALQAVVSVLMTICRGTDKHTVCFIRLYCVFSRHWMSTVWIYEIHCMNLVLHVYVFYIQNASSCRTCLKHKWPWIQLKIFNVILKEKSHQHHGWPEGE